MPPIPYDFDVEKWLVVENEAVGLDYAVLPLEDYYIRLLGAGGAEPIRENAWGDHREDHDFWALIGIPSESMSYDGVTLLTAKFVLIPLKSEQPPLEAGKCAENQFYARLEMMGNVTDMDGMSGGPIFSLKATEGNEEWIYRIIGVQSGWYADSKITVACPIKPFLMELAELVEAIKGEESSEESTGQPQTKAKPSHFGVSIIEGGE